MPDQHYDVQPDAIRNADTGEALLTREAAIRAREEWTAKHPPIPGLRWRVSFGMDGKVCDRHLEVIPGWEHAYAPPLDRAPHPRNRAHVDVIPPDDPNRLGALAYQGWFSSLPQCVRDTSNATWQDVPEAFREPLRQAAVLVWQHAENTGFHEALRRTLPSAQLGAAGELQNLADFIAAQCHEHGGAYGVPAVLGEITRRIATLRRQATEGATRVRKVPPAT